MEKSSLMDYTEAERNMAGDRYSHYFILVMAYAYFKFHQITSEVCAIKSM